MQAPVCLCSFYLIINFTVVAVYNFVIMKWYHYETNFEDCTTQKLSSNDLLNFITTYTITNWGYEYIISTTDCIVNCTH